MLQVTLSRPRGVVDRARTPCGPFRSGPCEDWRSSGLEVTPDVSNSPGGMILAYVLASCTPGSSISYVHTAEQTHPSGTRAGIVNTHFFIDPSREIGVVVMMQTIPLYDEASMKVYADVEEAVYRNLK